MESYYYKTEKYNSINLTNMYKKLFCTMVYAISFALTSCSEDVKSKMGLKKDAPDEFVVMSYPSLREPPNIDESYVNDMDITHQTALNNEDEIFISEISKNKTSDVKQKINYEKDAEILESTAKPPITKAIDSIKGGGKDPIVNSAEEDKRIRDKMQKNQLLDGQDVKMEKKDKTIF